MSNIANYIIFHPEREEVKASATIINKSGRVINNWIGNIFVDNVNKGNEDPFVFNNPWLYSYCHASQLRRKKQKGYYLQPGSKIIFVSGNDADCDSLTIDTVFIVQDVLPWGWAFSRFQSLPEKYSYLMNDEKNKLWNKHFKFPFFGAHAHVTYSYEAKLWDGNSDFFSYLPLNNEGKNVSIPFSHLNPRIAEYLRWKRKGKFPAILCNDDIMPILDMIEEESAIKVISDISYIDSITETKNSCRGGC